MELFWGKYGVNSCGYEEIVMKAKNENAAVQEVYDMAVEEFRSYEGMHGVPCLEEIAEVNGLDLNNDEEAEEAEALFQEEIESWIVYDVAPFDEHDEQHAAALKAQNGKFWEV